MRANRSSSTALEVARYVLYAGRDPRVAALLPPGSAALLERMVLSQGLLSRRQLERMARPWLRRLVAALEHLTIAGVPLYMGLRKRYFDDATRQAVAGGAVQVVILGAGLDTLGVRTAAAHPGVRVVEIDHPATQQIQRRALASLGEVPPNLHLLPADLARRRLGDVLEACPGWDPDGRSLTIAEGLLMYLPRSAVGELLDAVAASGGAGSRLIFSFLGVDGNRRPTVGRLDRLVRLRLALAGEPFRWGAAPADLPGLLAGHGFELREVVDADAQRRRYLAGTELAGAPLAGFERFAVAERAP